MGLRDLVRPVENAEWLEAPAAWLADRLAVLLRNRQLKGILSGTWLGHPLHATLTDVPIGCYTAATLLQLAGGEAGEGAVDPLLTLGLLSAIPTAVAGFNDWVDTVGEERRLGFAHALATTGSSLCFAGALLSRRAGARGRGAWLSVLGLGALTAGGYGGGHLVFGRGIGVDHTVYEEPPQEWTKVARESDLPEATLVGASANGYAVVLYKRDGEIMALADRCTHAGGPLHEGEVDDDVCVVCPWHASRFRLEDGSIVAGPATAPQPSLQTRVAEGTVEVRARPA
ncbi:MAG: Rieske (2Fe-2S) protein [Candidatus Dormibacteria bacterium]